MTLVAISYSSEMLESLHMGSGASVANVLSVDLSVLGFLWWNYLARTLSFFSPSFAFCAVQMKKLHWLFLGCGPALLSDGCPLEGDCGVLGKGDEDADQPMISPAAAYFLGVVLSKKKEGKKYSTFFFSSSFILFITCFLPILCLMATPHPLLRLSRFVLSEGMNELLFQGLHICQWLEHPAGGAIEEGLGPFLWMLLIFTNRQRLRRRGWGEWVARERKSWENTDGGEPSQVNGREYSVTEMSQDSVRQNRQ